jgi:hypothetical protein
MARTGGGREPRHVAVQVLDYVAEVVDGRDHLA